MNCQDYVGIAVPLSFVAVLLHCTLDGPRTRAAIANIALDKRRADREHGCC